MKRLKKTESALFKKWNTMLPLARNQVDLAALYEEVSRALEDIRAKRGVISFFLAQSAHPLAYIAFCKNQYRNHSQLASQLVAELAEVFQRDPSIVFDHEMLKCIAEKVIDNLSKMEIDS